MKNSLRRPVPGRKYGAKLEIRLTHNYEGLSDELQEKLEQAIVASVQEILSKLSSKPLEMSFNSNLLTFVPDFISETRIVIETISK